MVEMRRPGWESALAQQLASADAAGAAVSTALALPCSDSLKRLAVRKSAQFLSLIYTLVIRDEIDDATLAHLLNAPDLSVRLETASALVSLDSDRRLAELSPSMRTRWREIMLDSPSDHMWLPLILQRDHELCADWLRAWFERLQSPGCYEFLDRALASAIAGCPVDVRITLIQDIPAGVLPDMLWDPVEWLVSDDTAAAKALFERPDIKGCPPLRTSQGAERGMDGSGALGNGSWVATK